MVLPVAVAPIALNRSSFVECSGSGSTYTSCPNSSSISSIETSCFWQWALLCSSQSKS